MRKTTPPQPESGDCMLAKLLVALMVIVCFASGSWAETSGVSFSPVAFALVGVFMINSGVAIANGVALAVDNPSRTNGRFGWYSGLVTAALGGALYLTSLSDEDSGGAAIFLAGSGVASAAMGAWTIRAADKKDGEVRVSSAIVPRADGASFVMSVDF